MAVPIFFVAATVATIALACHSYDEVNGHAPKLEDPAQEKSSEEKTPTEKAVETLNE